ncbi:MAG TPA: beta-L-arabinofuranosidase domain-containing protein [Thermoanaerobaculia bacterium]|nr:beta-L-arabinofuranosidase domain-containing protein [Thermoanaerobaculia bacterium]
MLCAVLAACSGESSLDQLAPAQAGSYQAPPLSAVRLSEGSFWAQRLERNRTVTIPHIFEQNEQTGRVANFERAAGRAEGAYEGRRFNDTDVYKAVEAASYTTVVSHDRRLDAELDRLIELIAAAQEPDGYLMPARTIDPANPAPGLGAERWIHESAGSHELYNAGHLIEAAVAHHQATGKRSLLEVALRVADRIDEDLGPDALRVAPGHQEIEIALLRLAEHTGEARYRDLARLFVDRRGREQDGQAYPEDSAFAIYNDRRYRQDHAPVVEQGEAVGHAVRATYLYTAMAGLAAYDESLGQVAARAGISARAESRGDPAAESPYAQPLERIWRDLMSSKLYLTGGVGSRDTFESFGEPYELPNRTAYTETCAAIGNELWQHAMFLRTGRVEHLDVLERVLYNGLLSGVSLRGDSFFYTNPLESAGGIERSEYFEVACCPANLARTLARLPSLLYAVRGDEVVIALFAASAAELELAPASRGSVRAVHVEQSTEYPWRGAVRVVVTPDIPASFTLSLRIPGWARGLPVPSDLYAFEPADEEPMRLRVAGAEVGLVAGTRELPSPAGGYVSIGDGFARVRREWHPGDVVDLELPMPVRRVVAASAVEANVGRVALQRGPLVFAAEAIDNDGGVLDLRVPAGSRFDAKWRDDLLGGVVTAVGPVLRVGSDGTPTPHRMVAVPYFAWANRGAGEMSVWLPVAPPISSR